MDRTMSLFEGQATSERRTATDMSIHLQFPSGICVGGEVLKGEVELEFPGVQKDKVQEVVVRLRGSAYARLKRSTNPGRNSGRRESIDVVKQDYHLWKRQRNNMPQGTQTLRIPFQFKLPPDAPPSCQISGRVNRRGKRYEAAVVYYIEVLAVRSGLFKKNRYLRRPLAVLPMDQVGAHINEQIQSSGVAFPTRTREFRKKIRRGWLGRSATVQVQKVSLPDLEAFPLFTRIPYAIKVTTTTKRMSYNTDLEDTGIKLFPPPPTRSTEVQFSLRRLTSLRAKTSKAKVSEHVANLGGLGRGDSKQHVDLEIAARRWNRHERKDGQGTWTQETILKSFITLRCSPTFSTRVLDISYTMSIRVRFPGLGNNLSVSIPIHVTSGLSTGAQTNASFTHSNHDLDLPPPYWNACEGWGVEDEEQGTPLSP
ncbi:hypothetical protein EIP91_007161 [Steccherinum ochraceum]|uniref:Arrestin-like N-terminal domain-containing protein n=1 Tax=Steccherinum ochraceum TaxID=92696 RepID=A0A4R0RYV1_9APHY|nr:hypothetical protein EIP91_007161 [Steccherinum ochraceum]